MAKQAKIPSAQKELIAALARPEYTPAVRDIAEIVTLVSGEHAKAAANAVRALGKVDRAHALTALRAVTPTVAVVRALGQLGRDDEATRNFLIALLADEAAVLRVRREAAIALGKLGGGEARQALLAYLDTNPPVDHQRSVVEALGKLGGDDALARLRNPGEQDAELERRRTRAVLMIERDTARAIDSQVSLNASLPREAELVVRCRGGLAPLLVEEFRALGVTSRQSAPDAVRVDGASTLGPLLAARLQLTVGLLRKLKPAADEATSIADAMVEAAPLLRSLTVGPVRWRLDVSSAGPRRGLVWKTAQLVSARAAELVNDPTQTTWDVVVDLAKGVVELRPRRFVDERFAWRLRDVPAASHPTIAAALAQLAGVDNADVVWDPFCGSGAELIERALRGPARSLHGSDIEASALEAAAANVEAAGLGARITLAAGDARSGAPRGVTVVITNPPLGRRIRSDVPALLTAFLRHAVESLVPGGRLVWITPIARESDSLLRSLGMKLDRDLAVDLGGFDAPMQRWLKPR